MLSSWAIVALVLTGAAPCHASEFRQPPPAAGCFGVSDGTTWSQDYLSCCHKGAASPTEEIEICANCCCLDVDYALLRKELVSYAPALLYTGSSRISNQIPVAYVAGTHLATRCFDSVENWLASADPIGVVALSLFWLALELDVAVQQGKLAGYLKSVAPALVEQFHGMLRLYPSWAIYESGWPVFLLAFVIERLFEKLQVSLGQHGVLNESPAFQKLLQAPYEAAKKRKDLENRPGLEGEIFRTIWEYAEVSGPASYIKVRNIGSRLVDLPSVGVSQNLVLTLMMARADYLRHQAPGNCTLGLDNTLSNEASAEALQFFTSDEPHRLLFHELPLLILLDRFSMPRTLPIEYEVCMFLPTLRASSIECDSMRASWVLAHRSGGCHPALFNLLESLRPNISHLVDVGAQFGSCSLVAARRLPWLRVTALEQSAHNTHLIEQSVVASGLLSRLRVETTRLVSDMHECDGSSERRCSTLDVAYPFAWQGILPQTERHRVPGLFLWLSQLAESLEPILVGASEIIRRQLVEVIAVVVAKSQVRSIRQFFTEGYTVNVLHGGRSELGHLRYDIVVATTFKWEVPSK